MKKVKDRDHMAKYLKESGMFLLFWLCFMVVLTSVLFFVNITITFFHLPISFIISSIIYYLLTKKKNTIQEFGQMIILSVLVIIVSTFISTFMFDRSSDGNTYHKDAVGVLKEGFNPVYESSVELISKRTDDSKLLTQYSIWIDHYAKANWIIGANFYAFTQNVESGKAMNFIVIYIVFCFVVTTLFKVLDMKKSLLIAVITVFNPVVVSQMFTYYNDQLVCLFLFLTILFLIKLDKNIEEKGAWVGYLFTFILLANMKFNGLGYLLVFSFLFVCRYLYKSYKVNQFFVVFKKLCFLFIPLFIMSFAIVGYPTYVKNTIDHQNPFFPLYDDNGEDIITAQQPKRFLKMNNLEKLFYATFSKANNLREHDKTQIKIPFTVYKEELTPSMSNDLRISGWGVFFSGLLLCSFLILIKYYQSYQKESWILYTLGITVLLLLIMSESWWARYTPHFYLFIILSLYVLLKYGKTKKIHLLYIVLILANTLLPLVGNCYYTLKNSLQIHRDLTSLSSQEIIVNEKGMNGVIYNLKDYDIRYNIDATIQGQELYYHYLEYQGRNQ
ncbi:MAG: hypothetical protein PUB18_06120 [bacterium]|nr:hypothetical protein [bacterium]